MVSRYRMIRPTVQLGQVAATIMIINHISNCQLISCKLKFNRNFTFNCRFQIKREPVKIQLVLTGFLSWKFNVQLVMSDHVNSTGTS